MSIARSSSSRVVPSNFLGMAVPALFNRCAHDSRTAIGI
jgi:hypothetical protein